MKALLITEGRRMIMDDLEIIKLFIARNKTAVVEVEKKYSGICRSIALSMLNNPEDAEECVNDVYMVLWSRIPPAPKNLKAYICKVTRNICLKKIEYNSAKKRNDKLKVSFSELTEEPYDENFMVNENNTELGEIISRFLRSQNSEIRIMFLRRYWLMESTKEIASRFLCSESKVKSTLFRTRSKLKKYLKKEGIDI